MPKIELKDLEELWNFKASKEFADEFATLDLNFKNLEDNEKDAAILRVLEALGNDLVTVGPHRADDWERGWGENFENFKATKNMEDVIPKYFNKIPLIRWKQEWVQPISPTMEYDVLGLLINFITEKYLMSFGNIYEFGCGTGHNLLRIRKRMPQAKLHGLDWAASSQDLIDELSATLGDLNLYSSNFNYFEPNYAIEIPENSAVITVASLEQTGENFVDFISYLIDKKPKLVIHIEPMWEPLDKNNLLDYLSIKYFEKRKYLNGLQNHLERLEKQNQVEIVSKQRTYVGSFFIDGYSLLVWRPV